MTDLFDQAAAGDARIPLAQRMRPRTLAEMAGQKHLLDPGKILRQVIEQDKLPSMILWGPPGTGKTTLAMLIAKYTGADFKAYSAVTSGIKELKEVLQQARELLKYQQRKTTLFIDEIHRFNQAQQDAFLPYVERGEIILVGATTENPSFEINSALLSRCQVFVLQSLDLETLTQILKGALREPGRGLGDLQLQADEKVLVHLAQKAHGDARAALNALDLAAELSVQAKAQIISLETAEEALQQKALRYDRQGEEHYNLISALHKSVRGSDPDAALYWLGRMLEAGEEPRFLLRRLARMASEDIGLADPQALVLAASARQVFDFVGLPEGKLALAELVIYLSLAPKSNALEMGYGKVVQAVQLHGELDVPLHIRNAPTRLMKKLGYGKDYRYAHDYEGHWVAEDYLPDAIQDQRFYEPGKLGWEGKRLPEVLERIQKKLTARKHKKEGFKTSGNA